MAIRGVFFVFTVSVLVVSLWSFSVGAECNLTGSISADGLDIAAVLNLHADISALSDWEAAVQLEIGQTAGVPKLKVERMELRTQPLGMPVHVRHNGFFWPTGDRFRLFDDDAAVQGLAARLVRDDVSVSISEAVVDREGNPHKVFLGELDRTWEHGALHTMAAHHDTGSVWVETAPDQWDFRRRHGQYLTIQVEQRLGDLSVAGAVGHRTFFDEVGGERRSSASSALFASGRYRQGSLLFEADVRHIDADFRSLFTNTQALTPNRKGLRWMIQWDRNAGRVRYVQQDHQRTDGLRSYRRRQLRLENRCGARQFLLIQWQPTSQLRFGWRTGDVEWEARLDIPELRCTYEKRGVRVVGSLRPLAGWRLEFMYRQQPSIRWVFKRSSDPGRYYLFGSVLWELGRSWWELSLGEWDRGSFPARFTDEPQLRLQFGWTF